MNKKVSIIIPIYNGKKYISKLIDCFLNQSYKNIEVLLYDDGSTDDTLCEMKKYAKKYDFIKVTTHKNSGQGITRNEGLKLATGYFVTFMDQDDTIDNNYIEMMVNNIKANDILLSGYNRVENDKIIKKNIPKNTDWSFYKYGATWGKLYKKSFLINNNLEFGSFNGEDIYMFMNSIAVTSKKTIIEYAGYNNYVNLTSITHVINDKKETRSKIDSLLNKIEDSEWSLKLNQDYLLFFYLKSVVLHLFTQRHILDIEELCEEYDYYFNWLLKVYQKRNKKITFYFQKSEELYVNIAVNVIVLFRKLKLTKLLLKVLKKVNNNVMK